MNHARPRLAQRRPIAPIATVAWPLLALAAASCAGPQTAQTLTTTSATMNAGKAPISSEEAKAIVRDAYVYAYPMILQDITRIQGTNVEARQTFPHAPPNEFVHARAFPSPDEKIVVRMNVDTLYSVAWLDLAEPVVLSVPATDRYFMLQMLSMWTDVFAAPGSRTTGKGRAVDFLVVGPDWSGEVPAGLELLRAPTRRVGIIGRTQTNGVADYANVHKVQDQFKLTPLSSWGRPLAERAKHEVVPNVDMVTPPPMQVDKMTTAELFRRATELMKENPPSSIDYPILHRMERVGLRPGEPFDLTRAPPQLRQAFEQGMRDGKALIAEETAKVVGGGGKGWHFSTDGGTYGTNYLLRAATARCCLGENLPEDAIYPSIANDSAGEPLDGHRKYVLRFASGQLPPVNAFWSVTAYDKDGYLIPNAIHRQALGDRDAMKPNADGSLELFIQAESPGPEKEANWLPVAKAPFNLLLRLYSPKAELLRGKWAPPEPKPVD